MPEKVNHIDETSVITAKDGNKFLCKLVYVNELEKRVQGSRYCIYFFPGRA